MGASNSQSFALEGPGCPESPQVYRYPLSLRMMWLAAIPWTFLVILLGQCGFLRGLFPDGMDTLPAKAPIVALWTWCVLAAAQWARLLVRYSCGFELMGDRLARRCPLRRWSKAISLDEPFELHERMTFVTSRWRLRVKTATDELTITDELLGYAQLARELRKLLEQRTARAVMPSCS